MSNPSGQAPAHRSVASIRPTPSIIQGSPSSPHTPLRTTSSAFGSPSSLRAEEDCLVIELGARNLRVGFAGDFVPKAVLGFGPEEQRRAGDYRRWEADYERAVHGRESEASWGESNELWRPDLRGLDLGLVGDKIDRALREIYTKYLLIDSKPRRMLLALPSAFPLPLLSTVLDTLFTNFQSPNISLMSAPVLATAAAGLRSALVVDIGWAETVVATVYEYREVQCRQSVRGMKLLGQAFSKMIAESLEAQIPSDMTRSSVSSTFSFEECEDIMERMAWCKPGERHQAKIPGQGLTPVKEEDELRSSMRNITMSDNDTNIATSIQLNSTKPPQKLELPFGRFADPCDQALFATDREVRGLDDEELPVHLLIYRSLLQLPVDVRSICMSRIIFTGGGSKIKGLRSRVLNDIASLIDSRGWDPVHGKAYDQYRINQGSSKSKAYQPGPIRVPQVNGNAGSTTVTAAHAQQESDPIDEGLRREANKRNKPVESGNLRAIDSLGAWAGGSLLSQLKIPAVSIVDKDQWLQHGASGAGKTGESGTGSRQSMGQTSFKSAGDRNSWTLGLWG